MTDEPAPLPAFKVSAILADLGWPGTCDAIWHEGHVWIAESGTSEPPTAIWRPARIIRPLSDQAWRPTAGSVQFHLSVPLSRTLLDGVVRSPLFEVIETPDILVERGGAQ